MPLSCANSFCCGVAVPAMHKPIAHSKTRRTFRKSPRLWHDFANCHQGCSRASIRAPGQFASGREWFFKNHVLQRLGPGACLVGREVARFYLAVLPGALRAGPGCVWLRAQVDLVSTASARSPTVPAAARKSTGAVGSLASAPASAPAGGQHAVIASCASCRHRAVQSHRSSLRLPSRQAR